MNEGIVKVLKSMRVKLAAGWTQHSAARRADGVHVLSSDPKACSFCLMGALWHMNVHSSSLESCVEAEMIQTLSDQGLLGGPITYNDARGRTQAEILALVDKTIERLEKTNEQE